MSSKFEMVLMDAKNLLFGFYNFKIYYNIKYIILQ